jgi:hypothetical protein
MAGVVSPSMPVWIVENATHGNRTYCTFSEGLGEMLRFGAYGPRVVERLHWMASVLYPVMAEALARLDEPIDLRQIAAEAVQMGDEVHNRNRAATSLFIRQLAPALVQVERPPQRSPRPCGSSPCRTTPTSTSACPRPRARPTPPRASLTRPSSPAWLATEPSSGCG